MSSSLAHNTVRPEPFDKLRTGCATAKSKDRPATGHSSTPPPTRLRSERTELGKSIHSV